MPRNPQAKRGVRRGAVTKVNPDGAVVEAGHNTFISHEPLIEGMTWQEQVTKVKDVNPDAVCLDLDTILASDQPMQTFFNQVREQCPFMNPLQMERQANVIMKIVNRHRQQEFEARMKALDERIRIQENIRAELQRQLDERTRQLEQLRQQQ